MINHRYVMVCLAVLVIFIGSCRDDDDNEIVYLDPAMNQWLPYEVLRERDTIRFSNRGRVAIEFNGEHIIRGFNCLGDGVVRDCERKYHTLSFHPGNEAETYYIGLNLLTPNVLSVHYSSSSGPATEIFRATSPNLQFTYRNTSFFDVEYLSAYEFRGDVHRGIRMRVLEDTPPFWDTNPPKETIYLAKIGVVEWQDYEGERYYLE